MNGLPLPPIENAELFRDLVLQPGSFTLAAIREKMYPALKGIDDIVLIRRILEIRKETSK